MQSRYIFLKINLLAAFFAFSAFTANADIRLPAIFGSHMVVQQQDTLRLWGWAAPEDDIAVYCSWLPDREFSARADRGTLRWSVEIPTPAAGFTPHTITIKGGWSDLVLDDILFGEVWLCSGQSNMEWQPAWGHVDVTEAQYAAANLAVCDLTNSASPASPGYGVPNGVLNSEDFFYYLTIYAAGC